MPRTKKRRIYFDVCFRGVEYRRYVESASDQWSQIRMRWLNQTTGCLPSYQFGEDQVLQDQVRAHIRSSWSSDYYPITWKEAPPSGQVGTVIVLESPHEDEYDHVNRAPLTPLNNIDSRCKFLRRLGEILDCIAQQEVEIPLGDVVLCNPVPYQASLARLYRTQQPYPLTRVRNEVWRRLYGIPVIRRDFRQRLMVQYKPSLVINACTSELQGRVQTTLRALVACGYLDAQLVRVFHPANWNYRKSTLNSIDVEGASRRRYIQLGK